MSRIWKITSFISMSDKFVGLPAPSCPVMNQVNVMAWLCQERKRALGFIPPVSTNKWVGEVVKTNLKQEVDQTCYNQNFIKKRKKKNLCFWFGVPMIQIIFNLYPICVLTGSRCWIWITSPMSPASISSYKQNPFVYFFHPNKKEIQWNLMQTITEHLKTRSHEKK